MNTARPLPPAPSQESSSASPSDTLAAAEATVFAEEAARPSGVVRSSQRSPRDGVSSRGDARTSGAGFLLSLAEAATLVDEQRPGRFQFEKRLGNGAMGTVFLVYDREFEIRVAIKLVPDDPRAKREGCATAAVRDMRIITVRDMFKCRTYLAIVMEFVDGVPLDQAFDAGVLARDYPTLLRIAKEISGALACLHGADVPIVHRDLKGANVLVTRSGAIRVLDFGLNVMRPREEGPPSGSPSKARAASKATWGSVGTPTTMAPEQCFAPHEVGPHSDVFAFGAMFYDFATGRPPHDGRSAAEVLAKKSLPAAPLATARPDLPPEFCAVIDGCLTIDWQKRVPHDGVQLHDALLGVELVTAPPTSSLGSFVAPSPGDRPPPSAPVRPRTRWTKRATMLAAGAALLAIMGAAIGRPHGAAASDAVAARFAALATETVVRVEGASVPTPARVAVLGSSNVAAGGVDEADGARVAERIAAALEIDGPRVLHPGEAGRAAIGERIAAARASKDASALAATGVAYAVVGRVSGAGREVEVKLEVVDMTTGAAIATVTGRAAQARFPELMDRIDGAVRGVFSLPALDADGASAVRRALPEDGDAAREYVRALDLLARGELRSARGKLVAIGAGPAKAHARTQLLVAEIAHQVGAEAEARDYAKRARALVGDVSERERLPIEARAELASGNATVAVAKLKAVGPKHRSVEDTVRLAEAASDALKDEDGLAALHELEAFGDAFARDAHLLELKAALAWAHDDVTGTLTFAREAAEGAGERIAVRAQAKRLEAKALYLRGGDTPEAFAASEEAMGLLLAIDDARDAASLYVARGDAKYDATDFTGAAKQYRAGLGLDGVAGSSLENKFLERLTEVEWKLQHYADAERMFASFVVRESIDDVTRGYAYMYAAAGAREQGHLADAAGRLAKAQQLLGDRDPTDRLLALVERSAIERASGHTKEALSFARQAVQIASTDAKEYTPDAASAAGWAYLADHRPGEARAMFSLALQEAQRTNSRLDEEEARRGLSRTYPDSGAGGGTL